MSQLRRGRRARSARPLAVVTAAALLGVGLGAPALADDDVLEQPTDGEESAQQEDAAQGESAQDESVQGEDAQDERSAEAAADAPAEAEPRPEQTAQPTLIAEGDTFISEIHYDNVGADADEAIEVQAPVGTDLTGWTLVLYNGSNNGPYGTDALPTPVPDAGVVVVDYPANGIQNGAPDGVALVDASGAVVEFLSYEGELTASSGPALGLTSTDIGVAETSSNPLGQSLQRIDGVWTGPAASSFGALNSSAGDDGDDGDDEEPPTEDTHTIAEIQGTGDTSPVNGQPVTTSGVVTAVYAAGGFNGYYIQTPGTGGDSVGPASDAVFVFSSATVEQMAIGDYVRVTGDVTEYNGLTEITVEAGMATVLDETADPVLPVPDFTLPATDAEREAYEGMLVAPTGDYVVSDTYALGGWGTSAFGSIGLGLDGPLVSPTDVAAPGSAAFDDVVADNAARAVTLDDGQSARTESDAQVPYLTGAPDLRTGVGVTFNQPVIMDYRFGWAFQPTTPVTGNADELVTFEGGNTRESNAAPQDVGGDLEIATFNVLNYFTTLGADLPGCTAYTDRDGNPISVSGGCDARGAWDEANLLRQQDKIVAAINALDADVVSLEEIENSAKFGQDRDAALATLVDALNEAAGTERWAFAPSPAELPDLAEEDVIRTAFIYNPATVELAGDSVVLTGAEPFDIAREPLAQVFTATGTDYQFLAVVNHFKSKGGDCGDLPQGCFDDEREAQAAALTDFAQGVADAAGVEDVFLLGDFNSYTEEDPIHVITGAGYTNLSAGETTYVYDGAVGSLDHVFGNESGADRVTGVDVWNINSVESVLHEYSRYNYFASDLFDAGSVFRSSDHDPILVGIDVPEQVPPTVDVDILSINDFHGRIEANRESAGAAVLSCAVDSYRQQNPNTLFVSAGDNIGASTFTSFVAEDVPTMDVLNAIELDASAFGNHEFDRGQVDVTDRVLPYVDFPYLGANVLGPDGEPAFDPYWITEAGGVSVGFIGVLTEDMPTLVSPDGIEGLSFADLSKTANQYAAQLSDGDEANGEADVIVVLAHDGAPTPDLSSADGTAFGDLVAGAGEEIDAIISGHTHQAYVHDVDGMWVTQTGQYGEQLGHLNLTVDTATGDVVDSAAENVDLVLEPGDEEEGIPRETLCAGDPAVQEIVDEAVAAAEELGSQPLGEITADFNRAVDSTGENRGGESTLGNFVADVHLWAAQRTNPDTQIAFMNSGGLRDDLAAGDDGVVTYAEAAAVQPFANTLVTMQLTGTQLDALLEQQWRADGEKLHLGVSAGFNYAFDPEAPLGERVTSITLNGEPVETESSYTVVANNFLAAGGDAFTVFTEGSAVADTGQSDLTAMVDYLGELSPASPDYAQRSVGVTWTSDPGATYVPGDEIALNVSSFAFSTGEPYADELTTSIGGWTTEPAELDVTPVDGTDQVGQAQVRVTVPQALAVSGGAGQMAAGPPPGPAAYDLVIVDEVSGTEMTLEVQIDPSGEAGGDGGEQGGEQPSGSDAGGELPSTGADTVPLTLMALGLGVLGLALTVVRRRLI